MNEFVFIYLGQHSFSVVELSQRFLFTASGTNPVLQTLGFNGDSEHQKESLQTIVKMAVEGFEITEKFRILISTSYGVISNVTS